MAINRLLYLGLLILSLIFYFASSVWFSWLLLILVLALPILTLLVSLPAMLSCRLHATMADTVNQGDNATLHLQLYSWRILPMPAVQIRLNLRTRDRERDMRYLSRLHYPECLEQCEDSGDEEGYVDEPTREGYRHCDVEETAGQHQESP